MKKKFILFSILLSNVLCIGQTQYISTYNLDSNIKDFTLIDTENGIRYILDETQIYITSIDENGNQLWQTDPWKDNNIKEYRVERPIIVQFYFSDNNWSGLKGIWIVYNNTQFGILDKSTGNFTFLGQD